MADNVSIPRDQFNLIIDSLADLGEMFEENIERVKKLEKSVEKTLNDNKPARDVLMKILDKFKKKSSTPAKDQIDGQEDNMEVDEYYEIDEQNVDQEKQSVSHNESEGVQESDTIAVNVGPAAINDKIYGWLDATMATRELYKKVFKAMQKVIASENIDANKRVKVSQLC